MTLTIDAIKPDEVHILRDLAEATFVSAFAHHNTEENMAIYKSQSLSHAKIKSEYETPGSSFYFARLGDDITGYMKLNVDAAQTDAQLNNALEIERIYLRPEFQGKQIGLKLLNHATSLASADKYKWLWLGVWDQNYGAIRFYEREGFETFATHGFHLGREAQTDLMMRKRLIG